MQDPSLLGLVVGIVGSFERVHDLKRHALLAEQKAQALMADVVDHPLRERDARRVLGAADRVQNGKS